MRRPVCILAAALFAGAASSALAQEVAGGAVSGPVNTGAGLSPTGPFLTNMPMLDGSPGGAGDGGVSILSYQTGAAPASRPGQAGPAWRGLMGQGGVQPQVQGPAQPQSGRTGAAQGAAPSLIFRRFGR